MNDKLQSAASSSTKTAKTENPLLNLGLNIILPTWVLNQTERFGDNGALWALLIALAFPVGHSIYDVVRSGRPNAIAVLGLVNVLFTGGLALLKVEGQWFAVKEAAFPAVIGLIVFGSAFTKNPLVQMMIYRPELFDVDRITASVLARGQEIQFHKSLRNATFMLAGSFALSAILNFALATVIFTPIDPAIADAQRAAILNEQIAEMTWKGYVVIAAPLLIFMFAILFYVVRSIRMATGLELQDVLRN